ncbi:hypothetical protein [Streptomyces sp. SID3343]|uniref:hypothetical protein n=1 Tax=Streptomyces sp. SID3343 TaxID=2690260 RepID=UPI00136FC18B|nr:hypothetical protein [Streptomyces sp. SID3343]MYW00209.1 hypothetical protein [Streptomyces sp. SID3343]
MCGDASGHARTQLDRVHAERDARAEARAEREFTDANVDRIRDLAVRLAAVPDLQARADRAERVLQERDNRRIFPRPAFEPARWPGELRTALRVGSSGRALLWIVRNATLPAYNDGLEHDQPDLVADIAAVLREESTARHAVATRRFEARYGPDDEDREDDDT